VSVVEDIRVAPISVSLAHNVGVSKDELASASGVPRERLERGAELTYEDGMAIYAALERLTGDPYVGLHVGAGFRMDQLGVVGPAIAHAADLHAGLEVLVRLVRLVIRHAQLELAHEPGEGGLLYTMPELRTRHGVDIIFAAALTAARESTDRYLVPTTIDFQIDEPPEPKVYDRFFGVRPRWGQPDCRLFFSEADLALPMRGADPSLVALLTDHAPELVWGGDPGGPRVSSLESAFRAALDEGEPTLSATARHLGVSERTLQRRLREHETTFGDLRAELLCKHAKELLRDEDLTIDEIASRLGYGKRSAFDRAFRRWTGATPAAYRAAATSGD